MTALGPSGADKLPGGPGGSAGSDDGGRTDSGIDDGGFRAPPRRTAMTGLACVVLAMFLSALSQTVIATTMPHIIAELGGFDRYTLAALSYLVAATVAYPIVGRLSDVHGRRLFLLLGMGVFSAGSLLMGISESMTQVIAFRGVQGAGGGAVMTCCYASVADLFGPRDRGRFHGVLSAVYAVSFVAGPMLGGLLADALSWKWAFLIIGIAGALVLLPIAWVFPKTVVSRANRDLDVLGILALVLAVPPLFFAMTLGGVDYAWRSPPIVGAFLFSLAMIGAFIAIERRARLPIMPLSLYADPVVSVAFAVMLLVSFGLYGSVLFLPLLFQAAQGLSATQSGALLAPLLVGMAIGGVVAGQILSRTHGHYRSLAVVCAGLTSAGLLLLCTLDATSGVVRSQAYIVISGLGIGGIIGVLSVGVQNHVPFAIVGVATSALQFYRSVGGVVGLAILGAVLNLRFSSSLAERAPEAAKAALGEGRFQALRDDPRVLVDAAASNRLIADLTAAGPDGAATARRLLDAMGGALQEGLESVFLVAAAAAALSLILASFFHVAVGAAAAREDNESEG